MYARLIIIAMALSGCGGLSNNSTVADTPSVRQAMVDFVRVGKTTEKEMSRQWGNPTQKAWEGAQVDYIYRNMLSEKEDNLFNPGNSSTYVIVTFQYGRAVGVVSSDMEDCRATFPPRPPGHGFDNPMTVDPVDRCPGILRPEIKGSGTPPIISDGFLGGLKL